MKHLTTLSAGLACIGAMAGCTSSQSPAPTEQPLAAQATSAPAKLTAAQELDKYCRVCVVDKKQKMEEFLPSRLTVAVEGQKYKFCSEPCRKKFDANRKRYLLSSAGAK